MIKRKNEILLWLILAFVSSNMAIAENGLNRDKCRASTNPELVADCIEANVYDPCDDAGGYVHRALCGSAHTVVADRKIASLMQKIRKISIKADTLREYQLLEWSHQNCSIYREQYCRFESAASQKPKYFGGEAQVFCMRRITKQKVKDLKNILSNKSE